VDNGVTLGNEVGSQEGHSLRQCFVLMEVGLLNQARKAAQLDRLAIFSLLSSPSAPLAYSLCPTGTARFFSTKASAITPSIWASKGGIDNRYSRRLWASNACSTISHRCSSTEEPNTLSLSSAANSSLRVNVRSASVTRTA